MKAPWATLLALLACGAMGTAEPQSAAHDPKSPPPVLDPQAQLQTPRKPASVKPHFVLTSVGDLLMPHPIMTSGDPELARVAKLLNSDDLTIGNQEGVFFDSRKLALPGYGNGLLIGDPTVARDEKALGIQMVSVANNHATDWGARGHEEMLRLLDAAAIPHAGSGPNRQAAYAAAFIQTPKGRVALVGTTATFKVNADALDATRDTPARPGISVLRTRRINLISREAMQDLQGFALHAGAAASTSTAKSPDELNLAGQTYRVADSPGGPAAHYEMNLYDHTALLQSVRAAKAQADLVVFNIHAHESASGDNDRNPAVPDFLIRLFHDVIDAGGDVAMGGGPHELRGIEIYKGKPLFYGLGALVFRGDRRWLPDSLQANAFPRAPVGSYGVPQSYLAKDFRPTEFDSVIATTIFDGDRLEEVRLYPLDLGQTEDWARRGMPHLADPEHAKRILESLQSRSAVFGTHIEIEGSVGVIHQ